MRSKRFDGRIYRRKLVFPLATLLLAVAWLAAGCGPLAEISPRQASGLARDARSSAGQGQSRRVTILYTGYGGGAVDPVSSSSGDT